MQTIKQQTFCGREFTGEEILLIQEVVATCGDISRLELAHTVCELLDKPKKLISISLVFGSLISLPAPLIIDLSQAVVL